MERSKAKEAGRKKTIREKANALKDKPPRKAPTKELIKQAGRYHAIETAKKQLSEAQQAIGPDQEQQPYTAVDKVESYSVNAFNDALRVLASGSEKKPRPSKIDNPFHAETDFMEETTPKEPMRRKAIEELKREAHKYDENSFQCETNSQLSDTQQDAYPLHLKSDKRHFEKGLSNSISKEQTYTSKGGSLLDNEKHGEDKFTAKRKAKKQLDEVASRAHITEPPQKMLSRSDITAHASKAQIIKERGRKLARDTASKRLKTDTANTITKRAAKAGGKFFKKLGSAAVKAVTPSRRSLLYAAAVAVLFLIPLMAIIGVASVLTGNEEGRREYTPVNEAVEAYRPLIRFYASKHGIPEYEDLIAAVMMQESGGGGTDPMQCSESGLNTRYPHEPNSITDPEYSIDIGIQALAEVIRLAEVESPIDFERISLALQGYNYGPGYIAWALSNYGGYTELNAIEFSDMMAEAYGWSGYGDKAYVSHVLRYYPIGRILMSEGNKSMVAVALSQLGNIGGEPYWSWYGYEEREEWCAMFVSWVADQCGYINT